MFHGRLDGVPAGAGLGETLVFVRSAPSDEHPGQHDVQQEVESTQRSCRETKQRPRPQTAGSQAQDEGTGSAKIIFTSLLRGDIRCGVNLRAQQVINLEV